MDLVPLIISPAFTSIISFIFSANCVLDEILRTGAIGFPIPVPKPVVKRTTVAPEPTRAVVHSASLPGVFSKFRPLLEIYSP